MQVFLTGGTGFIGGHLARKLRERGDEVQSLVRNPDRAGNLSELGCELVQGDITDEPTVRAAVEGCDAVLHGAAIYELGVPKRKRRRLYETNVLGTQRVLRAALEAGVPKVVYISTVVAIGNTYGEVLDETREHHGRYVSYYEETKHLAHQIARRLIDHEGLPCVIVQPCAVYGPGDHSQVGNTIRLFLARRLPLLEFPDFGMNYVHVEDAAEGVILALDKGKPGEQYILGGEQATRRELVETVARVSGRRAPRRDMPAFALRLSAALGPVAGPLLGYPPNMRELISAADGVTFWFSDEKARRELGYSSRPLEQGLRETLASEGKLPATA